MSYETQKADEPRIKVSTNKRRIYFLILYGLFMVDFIARIGINPIFPIIQRDLVLTDSQIGLLGGIVLLGMAVFVLPISFLGEKHSIKKGISISATIWSIGSIVSGLAGNFQILLASRFMVGTGNAAYAPLSNSLLTSLYPQKDWGKKIGIYNTAMTFGGALGAVLFAQIASRAGWRAAFYLIGGVSIMLTLASFYLPDPQKFVAKTEKKDEKKVTVKEAIRCIVTNKALVLMCLGAGIGIMSLDAAATYFSIYCVRYLGMKINQAAMIIGGVSVLSAIGFPIGGYILDALNKKSKRSRVLWPVVTFALTGIIYLAGYQMKSLILLILAQLVYVLGGTSFHVATQELVPSRYKSVSYGFYVLFIQFLGALGPILAGIISDKTSLITALSLMQITCAIACVLLVCSSVFYIQYYNKARADE